MFLKLNHSFHMGLNIDLIVLWAIFITLFKSYPSCWSNNISAVFIVIWTYIFLGVMLQYVVFLSFSPWDFTFLWQYGAHWRPPGFPWQSCVLQWIQHHRGSFSHVAFRWASINNASISPFIAIISIDLGPPVLNYSHRAMKRQQRGPLRGKWVSSMQRCSQQRKC